MRYDFQIIYGSWFSKKSKILNDELTAYSHIAGLKFVLHYITQVLNYHLSQDPEFSRHFLQEQVQEQPSLFETDAKFWGTNFE